MTRVIHDDFLGLTVVRRPLNPVQRFGVSDSTIILLQSNVQRDVHHLSVAGDEFPLSGGAECLLFQAGLNVLCLCWYAMQNVSKRAQQRASLHGMAIDALRSGSYATQHTDLSVI